MTNSTTAESTPFNFTPYQESKGEEYMNEAQKEHFRVVLSNWKSELMREVDRTVDHMRDDAANYPDPNDRASQESEFSLELRTRDRERKLRRQCETGSGRRGAGTTRRTRRPTNGVAGAHGGTRRVIEPNPAEP